jgi:hypothetical protein
MYKEWIVDEEDLYCTTSLCDLEQSYILLILGRSSSNKDLLKQYKITSSKILPRSLLKIFILSNPYQGVGPKFLEEKFFSWLSKSKSLFREKSHPFVGYTLNWIFIPFLLVFKPINLLEYP